MDHNWTAPPAQRTRVVTAELAFDVAERAELVLQLTAASCAGQHVDQVLEMTVDQEAVPHVEVGGPHGATMQVLTAGPGRLEVSYRAEVTPVAVPAGVDAAGAGPGPSAYEEQLYLRPSRYCPSDHLTGFAVAEFGAGAGVGERVAAITEWIRHRVGYVPGSSDVHDSAEDTLLTGMGTCRDFAHLGVALCRATGIPARFVAVYAPGLSPMDFHAVFEAYEDHRWRVHDPTGLAPRASLVRIVTGRDAADTAFAAVTTGLATLSHLEVTAVVEGDLPVEDRSQPVELP